MMLDQLAEAKAGLVYVNNVLQNEELEGWERKEYEAVAKHYKEEVEQRTQHIKAYPEIFGIN